MEEGRCQRCQERCAVHALRRQRPSLGTSLGDTKHAEARGRDAPLLRRGQHPLGRMGGGGRLGDPPEETNLYEMFAPELNISTLPAIQVIQVVVNGVPDSEKSSRSASNYF